MVTQQLTATFPLIVNLILEKDNKVLLLYRQNTKTYNKLYALPAGKVERGESLKANIIREAAEEIGIRLMPEDLDLVLTLWAKYAYEEKDVEDVGFFFKASRYQGNIINAEPHKHGHLIWADWSFLPENMVPQTYAGLKAYRSGFTYAEY